VRAIQLRRRNCPLIAKIVAGALGDEGRGIVIALLVRILAEDRLRP